MRFYFIGSEPERSVIYADSVFAPANSQYLFREALSAYSKNTRFFAESAVYSLQRHFRFPNGNPMLF